MYSGLLYGGLEAAALVCVALSLFFVSAWRRRRQHSEYVLFALLLVVLAVMAASEGLIYRHGLLPGTPGTIPQLITLIAVCARLVPVLLLHFALRDVRAPYERRVMTAVYALLLPLTFITATGGWFVYVADELHVVELIEGVHIHALKLELSTVAKVAFLPQALMFIGALALLGRDYLQRGGESLSAVIGVGLLTITDLHDIAITFDLASVPLMPLGMLCLAYGVSLTLVARLGKLARTLEARTELLHQRTQQLDKSYHELNAAHHELGQAEQMALVGELAAVVAHQVRNPLAVVGNAISSLRKQRLPESDQQMLHGIIAEELDRLRALIAQLLDYSKPVAPSGELIDITALTTRSMAVVQDRTAVSFTVQCSAPDRFIQGDSELLLQAFENITSNAGQAMPKGGHISVRIDNDTLDGNSAICIAVQDEGHGMSKEQLEQARRPFYTSRPTGTGLGLALVARIVEAHGGKLHITSALGESTTVKVLLPRNQMMVRHPPLPVGGEALSVLP